MQGLQKRNFVVEDFEYVLAIDPGPVESGWVVFDAETRKPVQFEIGTTEQILKMLKTTKVEWLVIEKIGTQQGNVVGASVFDTCINIGRFMEAFGNDEQVCYEYNRHAVIIHLYGFMRKKQSDGSWFKVRDKHINALIVERYGGKEKAIGGVKCPKCKGKGWFGAGRGVCGACEGGQWLYPPGVLFGVKSHIWDALGLAMCFCEQRGPRHLLPESPKIECPPELEGYG